MAKRVHNMIGRKKVRITARLSVRKSLRSLMNTCLMLSLLNAYLLISEKLIQDLPAACQCFQ
jgi:hypothetical protein